MKVLILGATGYIGSRLFERLRNAHWAEPLRGSRGRRPGAQGAGFVPVDTTNPASMTSALRGIDCVVNCVAGDFDSIATGARVLAQAARAAGCRRIVHLSTMSVYGRTEGTVDESAPLDPELSWYARAKCEAEAHMVEFAREGGEVVMLRPGCVHGAGSELWVGRVGRWLRSGRLGDLGAQGDGWSNLVHVDDVCQGILGALRLEADGGAIPTFNLAAPDSPRWNDYFVDLAIAIGATPVRRISARHLTIDSKLAGPPLKVAEKLLDRLSMAHAWLPDPLPPSVVRLFAQEIRLNSDRAGPALGLQWTGYQQGVQDCARWFSERYSADSR